MTDSTKSEAVMLAALHAQIEEICNNFKVIRKEASEIVNNSQMPDATLHLNDVLQSTEEAATVILDAATAITYVADSIEMPAEAKQKINAEVSRIYEACSFQDISGQRIKKVLGHVNALETQLLHLSDTAKKQPVPREQSNSLMNGPQLSSQAPSQAEIDQLFSQTK